MDWNKPTTKPSRWRGRSKRVSSWRLCPVLSLRDTPRPDYITNSTNGVFLQPRRRGAFRDAAAAYGKGAYLKIVSLNCNGIRSAARKGFYSWMERADPDFVCLQETKAQEHQLPLEAAAVSHYTGVFLDAERKGYSGVAIYAKREPDGVVRGLGWPEYDREARWLQFDYGSLSIVSFYMPSGAMGPVRQVVKEAFMERFLPELARLRKTGRSYIICGDFNIAHREIDVYNPVRCSKSPASSRTNARGSTGSSTSWAGSTAFVRSIRSPNSSVGGRTSRTRSNATTDGASTISC